MSLTKAQLIRYSRQLMLPQVQPQGQQALINSHAVILGAGGLGCSAAQWLASSGVGTLTLVDHDRVELSNLHRQILHTDRTIKQLKVESAKAALLNINPELTVQCITQHDDDQTLLDLFTQADVVLECCDSFPARFRHNKLCKQAKTALVSGAAIRTDGQLYVFNFPDPDASCYRCLFDEQAAAADSCSSAGIMPPVVGIIGAAQAQEALKILLGMAPAPQLLLYDGLQNNWRTLQLTQDPACPVCQTAQTEPQCN